MKIKSQKYNKNIIYTLFTIVILGGAYCAYLLYWNPDIDMIADKANYSSPSSEQVLNGENVKTATIAKDKNASNKNPDSSKPPGAFTGQITAASVSSGILQIRTNIDGVHSQGSCSLKLTMDGKATITKSADIQPLPQSSTCMGFDIPTSELQSGTWKITIDITINNKTIQLTKSVEVDT